MKFLPFREDEEKVFAVEKEEDGAYDTVDLFMIMQHSMER
jgi:hypothetical protein